MSLSSRVGKVVGSNFLLGRWVYASYLVFEGLLVFVRDGILSVADYNSTLMGVIVIVVDDV